MQKAPGLNRRELCSAAATTIAASSLALPGLLFSERTKAVNAVTQPSDTDSIRTFRVNVPEADLIDLRRRIKATRLPEKEPVADHSQGVPLATVEKLARYWANEYDWRKCETKFNAFAGFMTEIDGLDIHFLHARSRHENALPIIVTHGWPGSIVEQLKIIDPLINPTAHGGSASDAFHVVVPSMPGYGYSGKPTSTGWGPDRIARAWAVLMKRLGYTRYVATGGDWGAVVTDLMAVQAPPGLIGMHTNFAGAVPVEIDKAAQVGAPAPAGLSAEEKIAYDMLVFTYKNVQYAFYMASRPQTLYGIADSPVGLAAWLLDHDPRSLAMIARSFDGVAEGMTRDDVLDNCTHFWLTNTAVSSSRLYRENTFNYFSPKGVKIPVAVSVFPDELYHAPRSWAEKAYPK
ncbi:MAG TPA: epoxide hydrolase, partial [Nitrospiraceae bacterium]|nr:epoxide hydrolase [Nitrospiraceae bacterium]